MSKTKQVNLWAGPLDGKTVKVLTDDTYYSTDVPGMGRVLYEPSEPGDVALGRYRYQETGP